MRNYAISGGAVSGIFLVFAALLIPPRFEEPDMLVAIGPACSATIDGESENARVNSEPN